MGRTRTNIQAGLYDVIVIGAGINGAASARELVRAGYSVLLVDRGDFAAGASSRSSRILHCGLRYFETHVRPLLAKHCYECHSAEAKKLKAHLYLDRRAGWERGGDQGPAIVPGSPDESLLIRAVRYRDATLEMPPKGPLPVRLEPR